MLGYGLLNLGSLLLGLTAWILPVASLAKYGKAGHKNWHVFSAASICACAVSLYMQILYGNYLVKIADWSALMDTSDAVSLVSTVLLVVTIALNAITLAVYNKRGTESGR